jgi:hypothetical protein
MTENPAAIAALIVFGVIHLMLAGLQSALAAGAPLGRFAWGGKYRVLPTRLRAASLVTIALYLLFCLVALERAGVSALLPGVVADVGIWVLAAYFALGILMNSISGSTAERLTMAPTCLLLAVSSVILAAS